MICFEDGLDKDVKFFLKNEKLYFCPSVFNTDDSMQAQQVDLTQLSDINVLVDHEPAQVDHKGRELGATLGGIFGLIIAYLIECTILGYFYMVLLGTSVRISAMDKSKKEKDAILKLDFNDNSMVAMKVDREERAQLILILQKYKETPALPKANAIYLTSHTSNQKSAARDRYWQIPCLFWFLSIPMVSFMKWFLEGQKKIQEAQGMYMLIPIENVETILFNILSWQPVIAIIMVLYHFINGTRRSEKLSRQDQITAL